MKKRIRSFLYSFVFIALLGGLSAFYWVQNTEEDQEYLTASISRGNVEDMVTAYGIIQPLDYVDIGSQVSGILKKLYVGIGSEVQKGDTLAEIDDLVFRSKVDAGKASIANLHAQLALKEAEEHFAKLQHKRTQELVKQKAASEELAESHEAIYKSAVASIASIKAQIEQAEAQLRSDEANLSYTKILAPMTGTVITLPARQGQTLNANQTAPNILRIADLDTMTVWAQVSEADVPKLKPGIPAHFNTLGALQTERHGKVRIIYPTPENISGAMFYNVLFDVENKDHTLMSQMTAQVFFTLASAKNALLIPTVALQKAGKAHHHEKDKNQYVIKVLKDGDVQEQLIQVGVKGRLYAEVLSGVQEGDVVIIGSKSQGNGNGGSSGSAQPRPSLQAPMRRR